MTPDRIFFVTDFGASSGGRSLQTLAIQSAINACHAAGGGTVSFAPGQYTSGALQLRDGVHLHLEAGATLLGSDQFKDYEQKRRNSSLISGVGLRDVGISGPGTIDGADCVQEDGEEGFRGPHAVLLTDCSEVRFSALTVQHAGNYAFLLTRCTGITFTDTRIVAGHDGFHLQACADVTISGCDVRTGDDCVAGCDNERVTVEKTYLNSSCNAFRFGCRDFFVRHCTFQGPGEHPHRVSVRHGQPRTNMGAAFVHFAPDDRDPQLPSDRWLIEDCVMDTIGAVYSYDFESGVWQTGQPALELVFRRIHATNIERPVRIVGDRQYGLELTLSECSIGLDPAHSDESLIVADHFGLLRIEKVRFEGGVGLPAVVALNGRKVEIQDLDTEPWNPQPLKTTAVDTVSKSQSRSAAHGVQD